MYVCKSLFKHGKSSVTLIKKLKTKTNYSCFTWLQCGNPIISQLLFFFYFYFLFFFLISQLLDAQRMKHFLSFWASYSITWSRCKRSFVSNNRCLVWTGSAFPQSFLSSKQSDAERKDFVDIPKEGNSSFYTSLRLFDSTWIEITSSYNFFKSARPHQ